MAKLIFILSLCFTSDSSETDPQMRIHIKVTYKEVVPGESDDRVGE